MINLNQLSKIITSKKKRVGRGAGSGIGAKSGRGTTRHQAARQKIKLRYEGGQNTLTKKFPLLRGKGKQKSHFAKPVLITLTKLNQFPKGTVITAEVLIKAKIVDDKARKNGVKVMNVGTLSTALIVKVAASASAKKQVEVMGGTIES